MKGIFRRLGSPAANKGKEPQQQSSEGGSVTEQLARAESLLQEIRSERGANFPLLNNATRLGMHLCYPLPADLYWLSFCMHTYLCCFAAMQVVRASLQLIPLTVCCPRSATGWRRSCEATRGSCKSESSNVRS